MGAIIIAEPDWGVIAKRERIVAGLARILPGEGLITDAHELVPYETDGFTAYSRVPLAVVLPETTEEVSRILAYCHAEGVAVVPRGAGTSLCGGAIPNEDCVVLGVAKMSRVLEVDYANRAARVQSGITNIAISNHVGENGFFYAPDPSSQLACTIAGNIAVNSGGADRKRVV